jgi:hypothetical protein
MQQNMDVLALARNSKMGQKNGKPLRKSIFADATLNGRFDVLKWLRNNKCPWGDKTCYPLFRCCIKYNI